jgi:hypothetical protein
MVETGADRDHLESLTNEQFRRLMAVMALAYADEALAAAGEATGLTDKALRSVTLPDGSGVLIDADCEHTDDESRDAYLAGHQPQDE